MISEKEKETILSYARKYNLEKVILFGSSKERADSRDIDIGVRGIAPKLFFDFCWEFAEIENIEYVLIELEKVKNKPKQILSINQNKTKYH